MRIRSLITAPAAGATLPPGEHRVRGLAWSGPAPIERVEVSVDGGARWEPAELVSDPERYAWRRWEYRWDAATTLVAEGPPLIEDRLGGQVRRTWFIAGGIAVAYLLSSRFRRRGRG